MRPLDETFLTTNTQSTIPPLKTTNSTRQNGNVPPPSQAQLQTRPRGQSKPRTMVEDSTKQPSQAPLPPAETRSQSRTRNRPQQALRSKPGHAKSSSLSEGTIFPPRHPLSGEEVGLGLRAAYEALRDGTRQSKRPFSACLLAPDGRTVLLRQFSVSHVEHAEAVLCRTAAQQFEPAYLWRCFLFSTWEPCAMCAGTLYWANIGTLVYGASEQALRVLTGDRNEENMTMEIECREILGRGQKNVMVIGPYMEKGGWGRKIAETSWREYWAWARGMEDQDDEDGIMDEVMQLK